MRLKTIAPIALFALALSTGCAGRQEPEPTTDAATTQAVPTCGDWVVVVEKPTVPSGGYDAARLRTALLDGFGDADCKAFTSAPAATPADAKVLAVSAKASGIGDAGAISLLAVDKAGTVVFRLQEKIPAGQDGTEVARKLGAAAARKASGG